MEKNIVFFCFSLMKKSRKFDPKSPGSQSWAPKKWRSQYWEPMPPHVPNDFGNWAHVAPQVPKLGTLFFSWFFDHFLFSFFISLVAHGLPRLGLPEPHWPGRPDSLRVAMHSTKKTNAITAWPPGAPKAHSPPREQNRTSQSRNDARMPEVTCAPGSGLVVMLPAQAVGD